MEARSAWCAFEGRVLRRVLPLFLSFVCSFSNILLALVLSSSSQAEAERPLLRPTGPRRPSGGHPGSPQPHPLAHVRAPPKVQRQVPALLVPQALALSSRQRPPFLDPS